MAKSDGPNDSSIRIIHLSSLERARFHTETSSLLLARQCSTQHASSLTMRLSTGVRQGFLMVLAVAMIFFYPASAYAVGTEETSPAEKPAATTSPEQPAETPSPAPKASPQPEPTPPPAAHPPAPSPAPKKTEPEPPKPKTGPAKPTGADSKKYTYNQATGMWESDKYTWDPNTGQTKPKQQPQYSYNPATGMWDTTEWRYDAPSGTYKPNTVSVKAPPAGAKTATPAADPAKPHKTDTNNSHHFDLYYNASISNNIDSEAQTGDAIVSSNTLAGDALSGDALALANVFNLLQSSASFLGGNEIATFSQDIHGDVFGDLIIDPAALARIQSTTTPNDTDLEVHADQTGTIENNIKLRAASGNAAVEKNTTAGDATSGSAHAVANVVNMLNSAISSGQSFLGVLNIYGSLNGDILLPPGFLNTLLASNAQTTTLNPNNIENSEVLADFTTNQAINNNIKTAATTGDATVSGNTTAGNAATGNALTNVTVLNLTGRQVVASNSLLVFVNVLGKWVGVIMDAPAGATSAALGSGVTQNNAPTGDAHYDATTNAQINNNIDVAATTGDASVTKNTAAGNATSGNATASVNLLNIINSSFSFSDWFGVLFINVFDSWLGSFGVDTEAGELPATPGGGTGGGTVEALAARQAKVFQFVPTGSGTHRLTPVSWDYDVATEGAATGAQTAVAVSPETQQQEDQAAQVLSDHHDNPTATQSRKPDLVLPIIGFTAGSAILGAERFVSARQRRRENQTV